MLVQVAAALRAGVRPFDTVARWGGEEFAVLLTPPVIEDDVLAISERLRAAVENTAIRLEGLDGRAHRVNVTVSARRGDVPRPRRQRAGPVAAREPGAARRPSARPRTRSCSTGRRASEGWGRVA